jgi:SAM-dependent methyltransferase
VPNTEVRRWDAHWTLLERRPTFFNILARITRRFLFQPAVAYYADRYFPDEGLFVEMGCGTAESSASIAKRQRTLIGLDFSLTALQSAQRVACLPMLVGGNIERLPFANGKLRGLWNLGVMEHLSAGHLKSTLLEFHRVLLPGSAIILFWPTEFNLSRWVLGPIEALRSWTSGKRFTFFPDEVSRVRSCTEVRRLLTENGFRVVATDFNWRTAYIHMVVVAAKA